MVGIFQLFQHMRFLHSYVQ